MTFKTPRPERAGLNRSGPSARKKRLFRPAGQVLPSLALSGRGASDLDARLRDSLRRLPAPTPSPDFDARVLTALARPQPWWQTLWQGARPLLAGAACSLVVTLAAVSWTTQTPSAPHRASSLSVTVTLRPLDMAAVDKLLDRPGLSAASLSRLETQPPTNAADTDRRPPPRVRRASRLSVPLLA